MKKKEPSVKELRLAAAMTQEALANKSNLSVFTISRIERSGHWPRWKSSRYAIQRALGLDLT